MKPFDLPFLLAPADESEGPLAPLPDDFVVLIERLDTFAD
jgi:hypothetical protein